MHFKIETKDKDDNIVFSGTASAEEATFLFNVGISYLLAKGVQPMLTQGSTPMDEVSTIQ